MQGSVTVIMICMVVWLLALTCPEIWKWWVKFRIRFGHRGIAGWFARQWHRVTGLRPDYSMLPADPTLYDASNMHGAVVEPIFGSIVGARGSAPYGWGPPACCSPERRARFVDLMTRAHEMNLTTNWGHLSDEELREKLKTARVGDGLMAESAYRDWVRTKGAASNGQRHGR